MLVPVRLIYKLLTDDWADVVESPYSEWRQSALETLKRIREGVEDIEWETGEERV